ncbi:cupin domain-containing protein [Pontibacter sp. MBLB2868]|uniref:cupin domain-containing protein n=1 Tax=Pontibacter sp. MBLB2868 TaxID=3451555 RepID=UPI003F74D291
MNRLFKYTTIVLASMTLQAAAQNQISRTDLLHAKLQEQTVSSVKVVEIEFQGGQKGPSHRHPCPVVGYIVSGTCIMQVEGAPAQILKAGEAFYEPANTPIVYFNNYSKSEPLKFIAYYLLNGNQELVELLPGKKE